ncbi:MAG: hypothetical protein IT335_07205 [Thermomicrobiales bacterium]|nr:hypothetical protein [Thermomicrobiales bacterium]
MAARLLSMALDWQIDWDRFAVEIEATPPARLLGHHESFADAGVLSGARIVLHLRLRDRGPSNSAWSPDPAENRDGSGNDGYTWREVEGV